MGWMFNINMERTSTQQQPDAGIGWLAMHARLSAKRPSCLASKSSY